MTKFEIIEKIKNEQMTCVFICDTCSLFDIIRTLARREWTPNEYKNEIENVNKVLAMVKNKQCFLLLPEQIKREWDRNQDSPITETEKFIEKQLINYQTICKIESIQLPLIPEPLRDHTKRGSESLLKTSKSFLEEGFILDESDAILAKAAKRSGLAIAPAGRGTSAGDCIIYEHVLDFFDQIPKTENIKGIFLTSNWKDYCNKNEKTQEKTLKKNIEKEFKDRNIFFSQIGDAHGGKFQKTIHRKPVFKTGN